MAPTNPNYAKDQPAGFVNRIEKVAIVGATGTMGKFVTEELLKGGKHTVTAITRHDSKSKLPEGVVAAKVNYDDEISIVEALKGQQYLIITLNTLAPPETQLRLVRAAAKAGVPYVMPNAWCPDPKNEVYQRDSLLGRAFQGAIKEIEQLGVSSWIVMSPGFWYEYSLGLSSDTYGFDMKKKSLILFDDGNVKINTSTWPQCGRGLASFLTLKWLPEDENDKSPTIHKWANDVFYISSFLVSQRDMFESVKRVTGTVESDWTITHENAQERWKAGHDALKKGDRTGFSRLMYSRLFFPSNDGDVEHKYGLANDLLGLPKEDIDEASKEGVRICLSGQYANYGKSS
ncbi:isoflavone reductase family protein [Colletotrichum karsti]|uniref:Isoflavone reductase family protein n=1 Tax=Colletotrichum karsti TaxID=1095194 RepID=A0A9P6I988_9PEZI|nr:isoflavone reductase family protein [Colletotrichum karsti]KAF9878092.1 isoflavone reductase family protein [Colletotrichum karsti]